MKAVIVGAQGQLGRELLGTRPPQAECVAASHADLDITVLSEVLEFVKTQRPDLLINCAAYTAVDGAELKPDLALAVNADGIGNLAKAAGLAGARVIHVSTDYVFDGAAQTPYPTDAETSPLGVYGHSKLAGEMRLQALLPVDSVIVRTAWLYSRFGGNFVKIMLRLMNEREELAVVADQTGSPTWARGLAQMLWAMAARPQLHGIFHWTDRGQCSWYQFACEIYKQGRALGLIKRELKFYEITLADYRRAAVRPAYSVLDCSRSRELLDLPGEPWQQQLRAMLEDMARHA